MIKVLRNLGLLIERGAKHDLAQCVSNGKKTTVPRQRDLKREIVDSIATFLLDKDHEKERLLDLLR